MNWEKKRKKVKDYSNTCMLGNNEKMILIENNKVIYFFLKQKNIMMPCSLSRFIKRL